MSWIDVAIASLVVISALRGWSQGLLRQVGGFLGRVAGLVAGFYLAATVSAHITQVSWRPLDVTLIVATCAVAGGLIVRYFGGVLSSRFHEGRLGLADSALGASMGVAGTLVTCWFVAAVVSVVPWGSVGASVNHSIILKYVQRVLPSPPAVVGRLQSVLNELNVPSLFAGVVAPTLPDLAHGSLVTRLLVDAPAGVVSVQASGGCNHSSEGTGFVLAPDEVVTVAHLVAGQEIVEVGGRVGRVVLFDPRSDLAVVSVPGLGAPTLHLGPTLARATVGNVVGYVDQTVDFVQSFRRVSGGAISLGTVVAPGRDIYSGPVFFRRMDLVVASVTGSESGAPVLVGGAVAGVVVERAIFDTSLVYVVPVAQLRAQLAHVSTAIVSTQRCVN